MMVWLENDASGKNDVFDEKCPISTRHCHLATAAVIVAPEKVGRTAVLKVLAHFPEVPKKNTKFTTNLVETAKLLKELQPPTSR